MTWAAYAFVLTFLAALTELLLASLGLSLPLVAVVCFYLAVAQGLSCGIGSALFGGCAIDFLLGREHPASVLLLLLVVGVAMLWLYRLESSSPLLLCVPGAALPLITLAPFSIPGWDSPLLWLGALFESFSGLFMASACSAVLLPIGVMAFDFIAASLELDLFADAKERAASGQ